MAKLTQTDIDLLKLVKRSPKIDGWAKVSSMCMQLVENKLTELIEVQKNEDNTGRVRFTPKGEVISEYVL